MNFDNINIYKKGGGGGVGSYIITVNRVLANPSKFTTKASWKRIIDSYFNAETLYLSVVELDGSYSVLNVDAVRTKDEFKLVALNSDKNKLYTLTSDKQGNITVVETDAGGGGYLPGDITYEEI